MQTRTLTVEEFEDNSALPENAERRLELIHGEIVEKMPTEEHGIIVLRIASRLYMFVDQPPGRSDKLMVEKAASSPGRVTSTRPSPVTNQTYERTSSRAPAIS